MIARTSLHNHRREARRSFTLVELLVTITIILMLAGMGLAVVYQVQDSARLSRTRSTISKIDRLLLQRYATYRVRRVPISAVGLPANLTAAAQLAALRQLMRLEMPDRFSDIVNPLPYQYHANTGIQWGTDPGALSLNPAFPVPVPAPNEQCLPDPRRVDAGGNPLPFQMPRPSVSRVYLARFQSAAPSDTYAGAECLYLILTTGPESAREQFHESEIADADGDGWPEFVDGWGNPIYWLRWAPAFNDTDVQPVIIPPNQTAGANWSDATWDLRKQEAAETDHDPFDRRLRHAAAWRLVPLVYSAGPGGIYDISHSVLDSGGNPYVYRGNVYAYALGLPQDMDNTSVTAPEPANGNLDHLDNVHNHRIEVER